MLGKSFLIFAFLLLPFDFINWPCKFLHNANLYEKIPLIQEEK
jgi:hypothetical protein